MLAIAIAAASALVALHTAPIAPSLTRDITLTRVALHASVPIAPSVTSIDDRSAAAEHLASAQRAVSVGAYDVARREFVMAAALDRDAGYLPLAASLGLARVLYSQSYGREAAQVLDRLAVEAAQKGDADVEARALVDAIWLNVDAGQRNQARSDALRLQMLLKDRQLSAATIKIVKERYN